MKRLPALLLAASVLAVALASPAQPKPEAKPADSIHLPPGQAVNWTWVLSDGAGMRYDIEANGTISDGQNDAYDGGMRLQIGGNEFQWGEQGRLSQDGQEAEVGPFGAANLQVSRRIYVDTKVGYVRWIDLFENSTSAAVTVNLRYFTNHGGNNKEIESISGKNALQPGDYAFAVYSPQDSRPAVLHVIGDRNARLRPQVQLANGNRAVNYVVDLTVPAGKASALVFFQAQRPAGTAKDELKKFKLDDEIKKIPAAVRRILANVGGGGLISIGDIDLPRHESHDLVVLRNDNELLGTLVNPQYQIETSFGPLTLPADRVLGLTSAGQEDQVRLILVDAQVVVGKLPNQPLRLRLANGNEMSLPPKEIRTASYGLASSRPKAVAASGSFVVLRGGHRLMYRDGAADCTFQTEYGAMKLAGEHLASLALDTPDNGLHRAFFRNGSVLSGLLLAEQFELPLQLGPTITVRRSEIERLAFNSSEPPAGPHMALRLRNDDELLGSLADSDLPVETPFGKVTVATREIVEVAFVEGPPGRVQVKTVNGTTISGKLTGESIRFQIEPGPIVAVYPGHVTAIAAEKGTAPAAPKTDKPKPAVPGGPATQPAARAVRAVQAIRALAEDAVIVQPVPVEKQ